MDKATILEEIRRTTKANGGAPLGVRKFQSETGIRESEWKRFWPRFSDAVKDTGCAPNSFEQGYEKNELLEKYAKVAMEIGNLPTRNDLAFKEYNNPDFPATKTFERLGTKAELVTLLRDFCRAQNDYAPVLRLCENYLISKPVTTLEPTPDERKDGYVYLAKAGQFYKIGKTNAPGRREYELGIQLPEKLTIVHRIRTDDPDGIEVYWHRRFASKRQNGEWFALSGADVAVFKRRKGFM
jgi:hypothetical protein